MVRTADCATAAPGAADRGVAGGVGSRRSPPGLEELDRITRRIVDDDLRATRSGQDVVRAERHPGGSQPLDLCFEIADLEVNAIPAARHLTTPVGEGPLAGAALSA